MFFSFLFQFVRGRVFWGSDWQRGETSGCSQLEVLDEKRFAVETKEGRREAFLESFGQLKWNEVADRKVRSLEMVDLVG